MKKNLTAFFSFQNLTKKRFSKLQPFFEKNCMDLHTKFRYICIMTGKCKCRLPKKQNGRFWEKRGRNQGLWGKITGAKRKLQFV